MKQSLSRKARLRRVLNLRYIAGPILTGLWMILSSFGAASAAENDGLHPAKSLQVIELFTSQSCPFSDAGDANLAILSLRPDLLTLSFPITYWNYTGWVDTLAQKQFDRRQARYNDRLGKGWLSTPQMIINGRRSLAGDDMAKIETALSEATLTPMPIELSRRPDHVRVKLRNTHGAPYLVLFEPEPISVYIESGKNKGETHSYSNVVRVIREMDYADGAYGADLDVQEQLLSCAILVEDPKTLEVVNAARCD